MIEIADLHNHSLCGLDDGADTFETMCRMIDISYGDGVRCICFTPHYLNIGEHDCTPEDIRATLERAKEYCAERMPDMRLYCGSEVTYHFDCVDALEDKSVLTVADSRYVLVDFLATPDMRGIKVGVERILNRGYIPIVAHVERYPCLFGKIEDIRAMSMLGAVMQINASSLFHGLMSQRRRQCMKLLGEGLVDVVASDAHDPEMRTPSLKKAAEFLISKFGFEYAEQLLWENPMRIISNKRL